MTATTDVLAPAIDETLKARLRLAFFIGLRPGADAEHEMPHKFKCHDAVLLNALRFTNPKVDPTLVYEIVRLMPPDRRGDNCYRIKAGSVELAVVECEIRAA